MPPKHLFNVKRTRGSLGGSDDPGNHHNHHHYHNHDQSDHEPRRPSLTAAMGLRNIRRPSRSSSSLSVNKDSRDKAEQAAAPPPGHPSPSAIASSTTDSVSTTGTASASKNSSPTTPAASESTAQTTPSESIDYRAYMNKSMPTSAPADAAPDVIVTSASTANLLNHQSSAGDIAGAAPSSPRPRPSTSNTTPFPDAPVDSTAPMSLSRVTDECNPFETRSRTSSAATVINPTQEQQHQQQQLGPPPPLPNDLPLKKPWGASRFFLREPGADNAPRPSTSPSASSSMLKGAPGASPETPRPQGRSTDTDAMDSTDVTDQHRFPSASTFADNSNSNNQAGGSSLSVNQSPATSSTGGVFKNKNGMRSRFRWRRRTSDLQRQQNNNTSNNNNHDGDAHQPQTLEPERPFSPPVMRQQANGVVGFAAANRKRNHAFHQQFRSVPENDWLIEDYSCALQREILAAGRMYVSEGHICFTSNILGWVTNLVISFDEVVSFEKEMTAMVIPNAIAIQTLHGRHTIRSLLSRDATYDLLVSIWKSHRAAPNADDNLVISDNATGVSSSDAESDYFYDEDEDEDKSDGDGADDIGVEEPDDDGGTSQFPEIANPDSKDLHVDDKSISDVSSTNAPASRNGLLAVPPPSLQPGNRSASQTSTPGAGGGAPSTNGSVPQMGPATHAPTEFNDPKSRYDKVCKDDIIRAPLGQVFATLFGPSSVAFMTKFLSENQKVLDLQIPAASEDDKRGLRPDGKTSRTYTYIKPLNASVGPKQTKCILTEQLDFFDLDKAVVVTSSVQSPDVPSGNVFVTKTKFVLTWDKNNATRYFASTTVEWSGKSWFKGLIEKGSLEGQVSYCDDLVKACNASLPRSRTASQAPKSKKKRKQQRASSEKLSQKNENAQQSRSLDVDGSGKGGANSSGAARIFSLIKETVSPVTTILSDALPSMSLSQIVFVLVVLLVVFSVSPIPGFFSSSSSSAARHARSKAASSSSSASPDDLALYDKLWHQQETELWDWLDARLHMTEGRSSGSRHGTGDDDDDDDDDAIHETFGSAVYPALQRKNALFGSGKSNAAAGAAQAQANGVFADAVNDVVEEGGVSEGEIEDAIRVTEARLGDLQRAVSRRKMKVKVQQQQQQQRQGSKRVVV